MRAARNNASNRRRHVTRAAIETLESRRLLTSGIVFPSGLNVINVTNYGANPSDGVDDTAAIQSAIDIWSQRQWAAQTIYFPAGTYNISNTLYVRPSSSGGAGKYLTLRGAGSDTVTLKLANGAAGFGSSSSPKIVLETGAGSNTAYRKYIQDLTIDVGANNPGAIGLSFHGNNVGAVRDVRIVSSDSQKRGRFGFISNYDLTGPFLVKNLYIEGFDRGISVENSTTVGQQNSITFENITLKDQNEYGLYTLKNCLSVHTLYSENANSTVPVVKLGNNQAMINVLNADLRYTGGGTANIGAMNNSAGGSLYVRDVVTSNYQYAVTSNTSQVPNQNLSSPVAEFSSRGTAKLWSDSQSGSLRLAIEETPEYDNWTAGDWAIVTRPGGGDATSAIQTAMNSGKPVVALKLNSSNTDKDTNNTFYINNMVTIPASVRKVAFMDQSLNMANFNYSSHPGVFKIEGTAADPPLIIERAFATPFDQDGEHLFLHAGSRTVVIRDGNGDYGVMAGNTSPGKVFFENINSRGFVFKPGQQVWARQFNPEGHNYDGSVLVTNEGAKLWVLGNKIEANQTLYETKNGTVGSTTYVGETETIGTFVRVHPDLVAGMDGPGFINRNGTRVSVAGCQFFAYDTYDNWYVQEYRGAEMRTLTSASSGVASVTKSKHIALYVGTPAVVAEAPAAPSGLLAGAVSSSQINLTWTDNSSNETGFEIERATDSAFTQNLTLVTTTAANATSYNNTGLSAATTYYYRVRATNAAGDSANSNTAMRATLTPGDANGDGMVTIADLGTLASNWQRTGMTWADGDFTGDGVVSIADLGELATNWQAGVPAGPAVSSTTTTARTNNPSPARRPMRHPQERDASRVSTDIFVPQTKI